MAHAGARLTPKGRRLVVDRVNGNRRGEWVHMDTKKLARIPRAAMSPAASGGRTVEPVTEEDADAQRDLFDERLT